MSWAINITTVSTNETNKTSWSIWYETYFWFETHFLFDFWADKIKHLINLQKYHQINRIHISDRNVFFTGFGVTFKENETHFLLTLDHDDNLRFWAIQGTYLIWNHRKVLNLYDTEIFNHPVG